MRKRRPVKIPGIEVWNDLISATMLSAEELVMRLWGVSRRYSKYRRYFGKFVVHALIRNVDPFQSLETILRALAARYKVPPYPGQYGGTWIWKFYGMGTILGFGKKEWRKRIDASLENIYRYVLRQGALSDEMYDRWISIAPPVLWDYLISDVRLIKYVEGNLVRPEMLNLLSEYQKGGVYDYLLEKRAHYDKIYGYDKRDGRR